MENDYIQELYDFSGRTVAITGGAGVLCAALSYALASRGASVAVLDINQNAAESVAAGIRSAQGKAIGIACDVLDKVGLEKAAGQVIAAFGQVDILINGAGGNKPQATTSAETPFFDLPEQAMRWVFDLNLLGVILPSQVFGKMMAARKSGVMLNISSMNSYRPLTRIPAYSAAKAGLSNFTQWLAVHMATEYSPAIRVNAIAPGFLITEQNRYLLTEKDSGALTKRGLSIIEHTPMKRFGTPEDLLGTVFWLLSPASAFVTGVIVPVDGGFSAFSGV
jgi:NAD(P)-dependent dehydrogenase (short-subunit alcohol dehydrogenase family)